MRELADRVAGLFDGGELPPLSAGALAMIVMENTALRELSPEDAEKCLRELTRAIRWRQLQVMED